MHVVHCPDEQVDLVGLPNLLPIVSQCLNGDFPEALLLTDVFLTQFEDRERSLAKSLEMKLCCPLTLVPTVYGVLGSSKPRQFDLPPVARLFLIEDHFNS